MNSDGSVVILEDKSEYFSISSLDTPSLPPSLPISSEDDSANILQSELLYFALCRLITRFLCAQKYSTHTHTPRTHHTHLRLLSHVCLTITFGEVLSSSLTLTVCVLAVECVLLSGLVQRSINFTHTYTHRERDALDFSLISSLSFSPSSELPHIHPNLTIVSHNSLDLSFSLPLPLSRPYYLSI